MITNEASITDAQVALIIYLMEPGHPQRREALRDLIIRGVFTDASGYVRSNEWFLDLIDQYLIENPRRFCSDGILRLREFVGIKPKAQRYKARFEVEIEFEAEEGHSPVSEFGHNSWMASKITNAIKGVDFHGDRVKPIDKARILLPANPSPRGKTYIPIEKV